MQNIFLALCRRPVYGDGMKVLITKYATTCGVQVVEAKDLKDGLVACYETPYAQYFCKGEWHKDSVSAHNDVVRRFMKKRESLKKQLAALDDKLANALTTIKESGL